MICARQPAGAARRKSLSVVSMAAAMTVSAVAVGCVAGEEVDRAVIGAANDQYFRGPATPAVSPLPSSSAPAAPQAAAPQAAAPQAAAPQAMDLEVNESELAQDEGLAASSVADDEYPPDALTLEQWLAGQEAPSAP